MNARQANELDSRTPGHLSRTVLVPLNAAVSGHLIFPSPVEGMALLAAPGLDGLAQAYFGSSLSWVGFETGILVVAFRPDKDRLLAADRIPQGCQITLNTSIPWEIEFRGPVSHITACLHGLRLRSVDFLDDASLVTLEHSGLGGKAYIYFAGKTKDISLYRPKGSGVCVTCQHGISRLKIDGQWFKSTTHEFRMQSRVFNQETGYDISIAGEATGVTIDEAGG